MAEPTDNPYWNIYIPGPTSGNAWYQGYIRAGASDPTIENTETLDKCKPADFSAGLLLYTTGKYVQRSQTSSISTYGESYSATFSGKMISSATYNYSVGNFANQLAMSNQAKFSFNAGVQDAIAFGDKIDLNLMNVIAAIGGIKYEPILGVAMKIAPLEIGFGADAIEFKGNLKPSRTGLEAKLRGVKGVKITCNPLDGTYLTTNKVYVAAVTRVNMLFVAFAAACATAVWMQGGFTSYGTQEEEVKTQLFSINVQMQVLMALFKVVEAAGLVAAAILYSWRIADPVGDYITPEIVVSPVGVKIAANPANYMMISGSGIAIFGTTINQFSPSILNNPIMLPPPPDAL
jgi:hypothetical protein